MRNQYDKLMNEAFVLPDGASKIALLEEATRIADVHLSLEDRFDVRMELTEAAVMSGKVEKAIVAFAWCLHQYDQGVGANNSYTIIWQYKWICDEMKHFPEISLDKIEESLEDYKKRLIAHGYGLRSYYKLRCHHAENGKDLDEIKRYYQLWLDASHDRMSDCRACEIDSEAMLLLNELNDFEQAYRIAEPIFKGELKCGSVPHVTYSPFLLELMERKHFAKAAEFYQKSVALLPQKTSGYLDVASELIEYLSVVDPLKAITLFEKYVADAHDSFMPNIKYKFYLAASILQASLTDRERSTIHFPAGMTFDTLHRELKNIAQRFDKRNENDYFAQKINGRKERFAHCRMLYVKEEK